jgi:hypothetical protein
VVTDSGAVAPGAPDTNKALQERGAAFIVAMDIPRVWATGAQVFINPAFALMVFREQNLLGDDGAPEMHMKNVASLVLPTQVVRELHALIGQQLAALDAPGH